MQMAAIAARDSATRDDPTLPYHLRWVWDGRPFDGCDVLVRCYHGLGDTLQYARYLPALAARARSVTVEAQARLVPLLAQIAGVTVLPFDLAAPRSPAECDIEITELPLALRLAPEAVTAPYLRWSAADLPAGTIGLCAQAGEWDAERSIPLALLEPLCAAHSVVMLTPGATDLPCRNPAGCPFDMGETAALVAGVDLVVTVDTMIAHLAGALGRPTWLLLKAEPDWRWNPARRDTPWYPTMRLYPQSTHGDWSPVLAAVRADLDAPPSHRSSRSLVAWPV